MTDLDLAFLHKIIPVIFSILFIPYMYVGRELITGCYLYILSAYARWGVAEWEKVVQSLNSQMWHVQTNNVANSELQEKECHSIYCGKIRRYICHTCGTRFCDRTNTAFYDLRTNNEKVQKALKMAMRGMSVIGIAEILEVKPSTVRFCISRAANHSKKVN